MSAMLSGDMMSTFSLSPTSMAKPLSFKVRMPAPVFNVAGNLVKLWFTSTSSPTAPSCRGVV